MRRTVKTLAVVYDKFEAEQALGILKGHEDFEIIALTLEAEFYIAQKMKGYKNPIYNLVEKNYQKNRSYIFENFKTSYRWTANTDYQYIRDRLGYLLVEFDRSFDFANRAINLYRPKKLVIGSPRDYAGSSVIFGTLKTDAFHLLAKEKKIQLALIKHKADSKSIKQTVGELLHSLRTIRKQAIGGNCEVLLLATARQLCQMEDLIREIRDSAVDIRLLTYNVTLEYQKRLRFLGKYLEKEKLIDSSLQKQASSLYKNFLSKKIWQKLSIPKYQNSIYMVNYLKKKLEQDLTDDMRRVFVDIVLAKEVLGKLKPQILVTLTDPDTKVLPYINYAKKLGIKTVCIQHGAIYPFDAPAIYPVSEFFVVWGKISKVWLQKNDYFEKLKLLVGQSPFHKLKKFARQVSKKNLDILYLNTAHLVDQALINYHLKSLFYFLAQCEDISNIYLRLHPNQVQYSWNLNWVADLEKFNVVWSNNASLENILGKVDLVIYENTTAGFDAMLAGKPTVYYNPYTGEDFFNVSKTGASLAILSEKDLAKTLSRFLADVRFRSKFRASGYKYAKKYLGLEPGGPNRNVSVIKKLLSS